MIFGIHTKKMTLAEDVNLEEFVMGVFPPLSGVSGTVVDAHIVCFCVYAAKDDLSGADIKAICTEAGLLALRERRMKVKHEDFQKGKTSVLYRKQETVPQGMYL